MVAGVLLRFSKACPKLERTLVLFFYAEVEPAGKSLASLEFLYSVLSLHKKAILVSIVYINLGQAFFRVIAPEKLIYPSAQTCCSDEDLNWTIFE